MRLPRIITQHFARDADDPERTSQSAVPAKQDNPFLAARTEFMNAFGDLAVGKRNWQLIAFALMGLLTLVTIAYVRVAHSPGVVPSIVQVHRVGQGAQGGPAAELKRPAGRLRHRATRASRERRNHPTEPARAFHRVGELDRAGRNHGDWSGRGGGVRSGGDSGRLGHDPLWRSETMMQGNTRTLGRPRAWLLVALSAALGVIAIAAPLRAQLRRALPPPAPASTPPRDTARLAGDTGALRDRRDPIAAATREYEASGIAHTVVQGNFASFPFGHPQPTLSFTVLRPCVIELDPGELVLSRIAGDAEPWEVSAAPAGADG